MRAVRSAFEHEFGAQGAAKFGLYESMKVDVKSLDAEEMLRAVATSPVTGKNDGWAFPATNHWLNQFLIQNGDIPALCRWHPTTRGLT